MMHDQIVLLQDGIAESFILGRTAAVVDIRELGSILEVGLEIDDRTHDLHSQGGIEIVGSIGSQAVRVSVRLH